MLPTTCIGLDFSGGANAGEKIWVALVQRTATGIHVSELIHAADLPGGGVDRKSALSALLVWLRQFPDAAIGCDFPFALTSDALSGESWESWLLNIETRFPDADAFRAAYPEAKRATDLAAKVPFAPLNLRLYRQTFHGLRDVLAPLVRDGARVIPFHDPQPDKTWLLEVCPASLLKRQQLYWSYKGKSTVQATNRFSILEAIVDKSGVVVPPNLAEIAIANPEGDALDAIISALIVAQVLNTPEQLEARNELARSEGRVYF